MEVSTNRPMAALLGVCRLVDTTQKRRIVDQCLMAYSIQEKLSCD